MDELLSITSAGVGRFLRRWYTTVKSVGDIHLDPCMPAELVE
ncbi:hypothetical protein OG948_01400 [Embleya sp. NBC_00888]|nr:hypothetical protein OG948_01400 [Embleya sp. NBC_00888]